MPQPLISLPAEERILLYLSDFKNLDDAFEVPVDLTQQEIAMKVDVQRKHISRYLTNLINDGLVEKKVSHVRGAKQRMGIYFLTPSGNTKAEIIRKYVGSQHVKVIVDGELKNMLVSEIDGATSIHLTLSDIVGEALVTEGCLDMAKLAHIEEDKRRAVDERTRKADVYRQALVAAWRSGVLTSSEKQLIDALKLHLGVTNEEHETMEKQVIANMDQLRREHQETYEEISGLVKEGTTDREKKILALLKERFGLS
jgi:DNA-binding MarR family transcriptional regulator